MMPRDLHSTYKTIYCARTYAAIPMVDCPCIDCMSMRLWRRIRTRLAVIRILSRPR